MGEPEGTHARRADGIPPEALPDGVTEDDVVQSALRHAVRVYGLSRYRVDARRVAESHPPAALVLGFGNLNEQQIYRGIEVLGEVITDRLA